MVYSQNYIYFIIYINYFSLMKNYNKEVFLVQDSELKWC